MPRNLNPRPNWPIFFDGTATKLSLNTLGCHHLKKAQSTKMKRRLTKRSRIKVKYTNRPTRRTETITNPRLVTDPMALRTISGTNVITPLYLIYDTNDSLGETVVGFLDFGTNKEGEKRSQRSCSPVILECQHRHCCPELC